MVGVLIYLTLPIIVFELFYVARRLSDHAQLLKRLVALARKGHMNDLIQARYPILYGNFRQKLRWWRREENRVLTSRVTENYQPKYFRLLKQWEGNSGTSMAFKTLWGTVGTFQREALTQTELNRYEIEFLWTWELINGLLVGDEQLKDGDPRVELHISQFKESLNRHLKFYGRGRRPA